MRVLILLIAIVLVTAPTAAAAEDEYGRVISPLFQGFNTPHGTTVYIYESNAGRSETVVITNPGTIVPPAESETEGGPGCCDAGWPAEILQPMDIPWLDDN